MSKTVKEVRRFWVRDESGGKLEIVESVTMIPDDSFGGHREMIEGLRRFRTADGRFANPVGRELQPLEFDVPDKMRPGAMRRFKRVSPLG